MANYVLVHGGNVSTDTWNKLTKRNDYPAGELLGGKIWDNVANALEAQNHRVFAPTLGDEHLYSLTDHINQICDLIIKNDLKNIILVGHSYGGMVITGVAAKMPERIFHLVYLDALFPDPDQSLVDALILAGFDPEAILGGLPKAYIEKIQFDPSKIKSIAKTYILCTESELLAATKISKKKIMAADKNCDYVELKTSHVPQATMLNELVSVLLQLGKV